MQHRFLARELVDPAHRDLPRQAPHTAFVTAESLRHNGGRIHFDAASDRDLGKRYAAACLKMMSP
jgi:hypothetical protein